jgi:hypothetical protein
MPRILWTWGGKFTWFWKGPSGSPRDTRQRKLFSPSSKVELFHWTYLHIACNQALHLQFSMQVTVAILMATPEQASWAPTIHPTIRKQCYRVWQVWHSREWIPPWLLPTFFSSGSRPQWLVLRRQTTLTATPLRAPVCLIWAWTPVKWMICPLNTLVSCKNSRNCLIITPPHLCLS